MYANIFLLFEMKPGYANNTMWLSIFNYKLYSFMNKKFKVLDALLKIFQEKKVG